MRIMPPYLEHVDRAERASCEEEHEAAELDEGDDVKGRIAKSTTANSPAAESKSELEHERALWMKMDDHEKRKQYKRARKIFLINL